MRRAERDHLHDPCALTRKGRTRADRTGRCHHAILGDIAVGGKQPLRQSAARAGRTRPYQVGAHQQIRGMLGDDRAAAAGPAVARSRCADVHRTDGVDATIFQNPNVRIVRCRVERHRHSVGAGRGSRNVLRVINRLRDWIRACQHRWAHRQLVDVTFGVRQGTYFRGRVVPTHNHNVQVPNGLSGRVCHRHLCLRRRRRRIVTLDIIGPSAPRPHR